MTRRKTVEFDYETAETIRLQDLSKRIDDDFGYQESWYPYDRRGAMQAAHIASSGTWWTWTDVICTLEPPHQLSLEIEFRPEVGEYKLQLFWHWELHQPIVRYENAGRHRDITGPHLNWGDGSARPVEYGEIPTDNLPIAVQRFCALPDVNVVLNGNLVWIPQD